MGYEIKAALFLGITLFSIGVQCNRIGSRRTLVGEKIFDVTQFGAKGDGLANGNLAFMKAWNAACAASGPVTLRVPAGRFKVGQVIFTGPCMSTKFTVLFQGTIVQAIDQNIVANDPSMLFQRVDNIHLTGGGLIDGQGTSLWKYNIDGTFLLPISLMFSHCNNGIIENINFLNAKGVNFKVTSCNNMFVQNITVTAPADSPNTDGIVISNSNQVTVTNSVVNTGDDCVAIGDTNNGIYVSKITCGPSHGLSIGSLGKRISDGDVVNVHVWNCTLSNSDNGVRIKTYRASPSLKVSNITFEDIIMNSVKNPVAIDQHYNSQHAPSPSKVAISDVHFRNIRGTTVSEFPVNLNCSSLFPCQGIELNGINIVPAPESKYQGVRPSICDHAKVSIFGKFGFPGCKI